MMEQFHSLQEIIVALRNIRAEMKLDPKKKVPAVIFAIDQLRREAIGRSRSEIVRLAALTELEISEKPLALQGGGIRTTSDYDVGIRYAAETVDIAAEIARLRKEIEGLEKAIASKEKQLGNEVFCSRAPEKIIQGMEAVLAEQKIELQKLRTRLEELKTAA